jgi:hypothetical protein
MKSAWQQWERVYETPFPRNMWQNKVCPPMSSQAISFLDEIAYKNWDYRHSWSDADYKRSPTMLCFSDEELMQLFLLTWNCDES